MTSMTSSPYSLLYKQAESLISDESDLIANTANLASLIYHNMEDVNWVGFYFLRNASHDGVSHEELVLGPFSGQPACTRIAIGAGVCGTAYLTQETQLVDDVHDFPGHIACDAASESEVVVPFVASSRYRASSHKGVFDIDSPISARFGPAEQVFFEAIAALLE